MGDDTWRVGRMAKGGRKIGGGFHRRGGNEGDCNDRTHLDLYTSNPTPCEEGLKRTGAYDSSQRYRRLFCCLHRFLFTWHIVYLLNSLVRLQQLPTCQRGDVVATAAVT